MDSRRSRLLAAVFLLLQTPAWAVYQSDLTLNAAQTDVTWTYRGCFTDRVNSRTLNKAFYSSSTDMTLEKCLTYCTERDYGFAGVAYGAECYCDWVISSNAIRDGDYACKMGCSGNKAQKCGSGNKISVWGNALLPPYTNLGPPGARLISCFDDSVNYRALSKPMNVPGGANKMTVAACVNACKEAGYKFAGVEYGGECHCDKKFTLKEVAFERYCNMPCNGNWTEYCGGAGAMNVYYLKST